MSKNNKLKILLCMLIVSALAFTAAFGLGGCAGGDGGSSETNNQTAGVDESDIVKVTDDGYIFKAQTDGLTVSSAIDGAIQVVFSTGYVNYTPSEMFVTDDLLILFGNKRVPISGTSAFSTKTEIKFFNIAALKNNSAGYTLRTSEFNGSFYTARMFDNQVFVTMKLNYYSHQNNLFELYYDSYEGIKTLDFAEELLDRDEEGKIITPKSYDGFIIAKYNLGNITASALTAKYYAGESVSDVYCSPYAIYTISAHVRRTGPARGCGVRSTEHFTKITRISLSDLTVKNSLEYQGTVLNRYSLYDNGLVFFFVGSSGGYNYVYSYDNNFKKLGQSADFARWEDVHAVRFSGEEELCYVVTFRQVDPLFKIDISNPLNIRILGELKIDGYSTHLQTFGDGYLMGLGFDGDSWGLTGGIKLSLFGVTDNDPVELDSVVFGKNSSSIATSEPKAILCEPQFNLFAFPAKNVIRPCGGTGGAFVFGVIDGELVELAFLSADLTGEFNNIAHVNNILRIARIGAYLYTISDGYIASYSLLEDFAPVDFADTRIK